MSDANQETPVMACFNRGISIGTANHQDETIMANTSRQSMATNRKSAFCKGEMQIGSGIFSKLLVSSSLGI